MRALLTLVFLFLGTVSARAQGLVQLTFDGAIDTSGGGHVELEVTFADAKGGWAPRTASLDLLLAEKTGANDVAGLIALRLERAGARVMFTGANSPSRGPTNIFVEDVFAVGLRLGHGLSGSVTLCEDAPQSVRVAPGAESKSAATLSVSAHSLNPHTKDRARVSFDVQLPEKSTQVDASSRVMLAANAANWRSELKSNEWWLPGIATDKGNVTSCTFDLRSNGDWRLDVVLTPRATQR